MCKYYWWRKWRQSWYWNDVYEEFVVTLSYTIIKIHSPAKSKLFITILHISEMTRIKWQLCGWSLQTKPDGTCDYNASGDCAKGIQEYKSEYVDPFVAVLKKYDNKLPIILVIEPDSIPNLATNQVCLSECGLMCKIACAQIYSAI